MEVTELWVVALYVIVLVEGIVAKDCGDWEYLMDAGSQCRKCRICENDQSATQDFVETCYKKHPDEVKPWGRVWCHTGDRFPMCPRLEDPIGGHFSCSDGNSVESRCRLVCAKGYLVDFQHSDTVKCTVSGQWDYFPPNCVSTMNQLTDEPDTGVRDSPDTVTIPLVSVLVALFVSTVVLVLLKLYLRRKESSQDFCLCGYCMSDEGSPCSHGNKHCTTQGEHACLAPQSTTGDDPESKSTLLPQESAIDDPDDIRRFTMDIVGEAREDGGLLEGNTGTEPFEGHGVEHGGPQAGEHGERSSLSGRWAASLQSLHDGSDGMNNGPDFGNVTEQLVSVSIWPKTTVTKGQQLVMQVTPHGRVQLKLVVWEHLSSGLEHPFDRLEISDVDESNAGWYSMVAHTTDGRLERRHYKIVVKDARLPGEHPIYPANASPNSEPPSLNGAHQDHDAASLNSTRSPIEQTFSNRNPPEENSTTSPKCANSANPLGESSCSRRREPEESHGSTQDLSRPPYNISPDVPSMEDNMMVPVESNETSTSTSGENHDSPNSRALVVPVEHVQSWTPAQHLVHHYMRWALRDHRAVHLPVQESGHFSENTSQRSATRPSAPPSEGHGSASRPPPEENDGQSSTLRGSRKPMEQEYHEEDVGPGQCVMYLRRLVNDEEAMRDLSIVMDTTRSPDNFAHRHTKLRGDDIYIVRQRSRESVTHRILHMACQDDPNFKVGTLVHFLQKTGNFHVLEVVRWYHRPSDCPYCSKLFKRYNVTARRTNDENPSTPGHPGYRYHSKEVRSCNQPLSTVLHNIYPNDLDIMSKQIEVRRKVDLFCCHLGGMCKEHIDYLKHHHREEVIRSALAEMTSQSPSMPTGSLILWLVEHEFLDSAYSVNKYHCTHFGQCPTCQGILLKSQKNRETLA